MKKRVTGIGGVFFKAKDPEKLHRWYQKHLGIPVEFPHGSSFPWVEADKARTPGATVWSLFPKSSRYFAPSKAPFMINYRVKDLAAVLRALRKERVPVKAAEPSEYGRFAWISDPEGNRIELWEPPVAKKKARR